MTLAEANVQIVADASAFTDTLRTELVRAAKQAGGVFDKTMTSAARTAGDSAGHAAGTSMASAVTTSAASAATSGARAISSAAPAYTTAGAAAGDAAGDGLASGLAGSAAEAGRAGAGAVSASRGTFATAGRQAGDAAGDAIASGIRGSAGAVGAAAGAAGTAGVHAFQGSFSGMRSFMQSTLSVAAGVGLADMARTAATSLLGLGRSGLTAAGNMEQTLVAFSGLTGSAEEGARVFKDLKTFAKVTPFEFADITKPSLSILSMAKNAGFAKDQLIPLMTTIGNVTSATGQGAESMDRVTTAMGQIAGEGKVGAENLNQISDALPGFSARAAIAESMGISQAEAMKRMQNGSIDAKTGLAALITGMENYQGASGAMDRQSQTLNGRISTFKDEMSDALVNGIMPLLPTIGSVMAAAGPIVKQFIGVFASGMAIGVEAVAGFVTAIKAMVAFAQRNADWLVPLTVGIITFAATFTLISQGAAIAALAVQVWGAITAGVMGIVQGLTAALRMLWLAMTANPIGLIIAAIVALVAVFVVLFKRNEGFRKAVMTAWNAVRRVVVAVAEQVWTAIKAMGAVIVTVGKVIWRAVQVVIAVFKVLAIIVGAAIAIALLPVILFVAAIVKLWKTNEGFRNAVIAAWNAVRTAVVVAATAIWTAVKAIGEFFADLGAAIWGALTGVARAIGSFFAGLAATIGGSLAQAWGIISTFLTGFADWFIALPGRIIAAVSGFGTALATWFSEAWTTLTTVVTTFVTGLVTFFGGLIGRVLGALASFGARLAGWFTGVWNAYVGLVRAGIDLVVGIFSGIVGRVVSAVSGLGRALSTAFSTVWGAVSGAVNTIATKVVNVFEGIVTKVKDVFSGLGDAIGRAIRAALDLAKGPINAVIRTVNKLPGVKIPELARGGVIDQPTLAMLHPREVVIPLSRPARAVELASQSGLLDLLARTSATSGARSVTVNAPLTALPPVRDPELVATLLARRIALLVG